MDCSLRAEGKDFLQIIAGIASLVSVGSSLKAAGKAKAQGKENVRAEEIATRRSLERLDKQKTGVLARQQTVAAQQNVDVSSRSVLELKQEAINEFAKDRQVIQDLGQSRARSAGLAGSAAAYSAYGQAAQGVMQFASLADSTDMFGLGKKPKSNPLPPPDGPPW